MVKNTKEKMLLNFLNQELVGLVLCGESKIFVFVSTSTPNCVFIKDTRIGMKPTGQLGIIKML